MVSSCPPLQLDTKKQGPSLALRQTGNHSFVPPPQRLGVGQLCSRPRGPKDSSSGRVGGGKPAGRIQVPVGQAAEASSSREQLTSGAAAAGRRGPSASLRRLPSGRDCLELQDGWKSAGHPNALPSRAGQGPRVALGAPPRAGLHRRLPESECD